MGEVERALTAVFSPWIRGDSAWVVFFPKMHEDEEAEASWWRPDLVERHSVGASRRPTPLPPPLRAIAVLMAR